MSKQQSIAALEGILAYSFEDPNISWLALQAAGSGIGGPDGNKTLAMIGDAIMKFILVVDLAKRGLSRGAIDSTTQLIVSNNNVAQVCNDTGITQCINGNPSQLGVQSPKTRAATVEAILAAVFQDSGNDIDEVRRVMNILGLNALGGTG
ncbi:Ribonuclease 3 [Lachnellula cervina]|uniref:Ribonuclease 3 n=1 Tax=Lachnellula cervina TaxID=1316786 RepID=A0A7D8URU0_9HELO|nr:Ribonuclease 3 [Lachnellula cervina]